MTEHVRVGVGPVGKRAPRYGLEPLDTALDGLWPGDNVVWLVDGALPGAVECLLASVVESADCIDVAASSFERAVFDLRTTDTSPNLLADVARDVSSNGRVAVWICSRAIAPAPLLDLAQVVVVLTESTVRIERADGRRSRVHGMEMDYALQDGTVVLEPPSTVSRLGEALRAIRKQRGWSQADLGAMIGVSGSAISQTERGQQSMSLDTVIELAERLGVSVDRLVRGVERPFQLFRTPASGFGFGEDAGARTGNARCMRLPGRGTMSMQSGASGPQMILVGAGVVRLHFVDDDSVVLRPGDIVTTTASSLLNLRNLSDGTAVVFRLDASNGGPAIY